jgi:hypothetical protein
LRLACRTLHAASWGAGKDEAAKRNRQAARKAAVLAITFALIWLAMTGACNEWLIAVPSRGCESRVAPRTLASCLAVHGTLW